MTTNTITFSSELMTNYMQAEIMSPQAQFEALQTSTGLSLLFSVGTDNVFYVTQETHGVSSSGWTKTDLSSAQIAKDFSGKTGITCLTFAVAQNAADGTIGAAMVVNDTQNDHLYLCLGNSNSDASWLTQPVWVAYPYDNSKVPAPSALSIANVFISETSSGQYIGADIVQNPASPEKLISRYYIDPKKTEGCAWNVHNLAIDLQEGNYSTCLGRQQGGQPIDGLYTIGQVGGSPQFTYQPLYNAFDQAVPANPCRLVLPESLTAQAIASCRNSDQSTDLYVMANGGLYYFASSNQADSALGVLLFENSLFSGATHLFAYSTGSQVYIWGLNQADQVFYTTCPVGQINTASAWSYPLPILSGVDLISPYVNCVSNGNTFFAVGGSTLYKMMQSPATGLWASQSITLPLPAVNTPAQSFSSYTTRIQLADSNNQPVAQSPLLVSAASCGSFFINNLYYVLDTTPIPINTDTAGSITIIECVSNLQGTQLTVSEQGGNSVAVNPMDKPFNKAVQLNSASSLQSAVITNPDGSTQALIASDASPTDLGSLALSNQSLATVYAKVSSATQTPAATAAASAAQGIAADVGDIFKWLESGVAAEVSIVEDEASGLWHFIANIAGQEYYGVLDCVEKVVGAVQWIFNAIKTAIGDLIKFLQFLFDWQDITRTKQVFENLINLFIQNQINGVSTLQSEFDAMIASAQTAINNWAGITDWTGLGSSATASLAAGSNPVQNQSASTTMLSHHFQNNVSNLSTTSALPNAPSTQSVLTTFLQALGNEEKALDGVLTQFQDLAGEYSTLTLSQALEKIVSILADGVLDSAKVVMDALFEVLIDLAAAAFEILNTQIYIPVVSDILSDFGVPSFSFLDLFCWIAAIPVTIVYKIANNSAPFLDDANTSFLISATDYQTVVNTLNPAQNATATATATATQAVALASAPAQSSGATSLSQSATPAVANKTPLPGNQTELIASSSSGASSAAPSTPSILAKIVSCCAHLDAGAFYTVLGIISPMEAAIPSGPENAMSTPVTIMSICASVCQTIGNDVDPQYPIQSLAINELRYGTLCLRTMFKLVYSASFQRWLSGGENPLPGQDFRATSAVIDNILVIPAAVCTVWHFYELSKDPSGDERSASIIGETSNITNYISRISYAVAVNSDSPDVLTAVWASNWGTAGLQAAEAVVEVL